ncbi:hypothetical protein G6F56_002352 [Rhizopus delemar]|nr:hypothetical protein G6F56_002352 [Rhizopus delemar]
MSTKQLITLRYSCHFCGKSFSEARNLRTHLLRLHHCNMKPRPEGRLTRQDTAQYSYVSKPNNFDHPNIHVHHACISCLSHFADLKYLKHHINDVHQSQHPADNAVPAEEEPQAKRQRLIQQTPAVANSKNTILNSNDIYY